MIYFECLLMQVIWQGLERGIITILWKSVIHMVVIGVLEMHMSSPLVLLDLLVIMGDHVLMSSGLRPTYFPGLKTKFTLWSRAVCRWWACSPSALKCRNRPRGWWARVPSRCWWSAASATRCPPCAIGSPLLRSYSLSTRRCARTNPRLWCLSKRIITYEEFFLFWHQFLEVLYEPVHAVRIDAFRERFSPLHCKGIVNVIPLSQNYNKIIFIVTFPRKCFVIF